MVNKQSDKLWMNWVHGEVEVIHPLDNLSDMKSYQIYFQALKLNGYCHT